MFQFTRLLAKPKADAKRAAFADSFSAAGNSTAKELGATSGVRATGGTDTPNDCVTERARRDLDEQLERLADLLNRVEAIDFGQDATADDTLGIVPFEAESETNEPLNPSILRAISESDLMGDDAETAQDTARAESASADYPRDTVSCDIVLSSGLFSKVTELPEPLMDGSAHDKAARASAPVTLPLRMPRYELRKESDSGEPANRSDSGSGVIQDLRVADPLHTDSTETVDEEWIAADEPFPAENVSTGASAVEVVSVDPASIHTATFPLVHELSLDSLPMHAGLDEFVASPAVGSPAPLSKTNRSRSTSRADIPDVPPGDSALLNVLAAIGGLLTLATLGYVVADLAGWL